MDNGTPGIEKVIDPYKEFVRLIKNYEVNPYASRNLGVRTADSNVIGFLDAKCIPDNHWIEMAVENISHNQKCILAGKYNVVSPDHNLRNLVYGILYLNNEKNVRRGYGVTAGNLCASKVAFEDLGLFLTDGVSGHDIEWSRRALLHNSYNLLYCPNLSVTYHGNSYTSLLRKVRKYARGILRLNRGTPGSLSRHIGTIIPNLLPMRPHNFKESLQVRHLEHLSTTDKCYLYLLTWRVKLALACHYLVALFKHNR